MDFIIPLNKDDLLQNNAGQYCVKELTSIRSINSDLDGVRKTFDAKGPEFIFENFDLFFSVIINGKKIEIKTILRAYERIVKSIGILTGNMEKEMPTSERSKNLNMTKMHAYILSNLMCILEDRTCTENNIVDTGRKKKTANKSDDREEWELRRETALLTIYRLLQLPLTNLWQPTIVEDSFIMLVADICYKIIEHDKDERNKNIKHIIWQILGILIKRYIHGMTCKIKVVQLLRMCDGLASSLASGVIIMITENNCPSFLSDIFQEIEQSNFEETEARYISTFMETIASTRADLLRENLNYILDYLASDCYVMRNCAIDVIGNIILKCLNSQTLSQEQREQRDECLELLIAQRLDINGYVRSKVFQTFQKLANEVVIPIKYLIPLLHAIIPHLTDKSSVIRKLILQLLRILLECNPFFSKLDLDHFRGLRDSAEEKFRELQACIVAESASGNPERFALWQELAPEIQSAVKASLDDVGVNDNTEYDEVCDNNLSNEFETIRTLIIDRKIREAVETFKGVCKLLGKMCDINDLKNDSKEYLYLLFLLKIFLDSEQNDLSDPEKFDRNEWRKRIKEIQKLRKTLDFLDVAVKFVTKMEQIIPLILDQLYSTSPVVAIEACTLLGAAYQFKIAGTSSAIHSALSQVFSREESVRNNVAIVYKEIYLKNDNNLSERQKAIFAVNGLIKLFKDLQPGQSPALTQLISLWFGSNDLNDETIQVMWEKYSFKIPETTITDSRSAVALITMVAQNQPKLIATNVNTFIKVGLKDYGRANLLLARDTCRALLKHPLNNGDSTKEPMKYCNDHELFQELSNLLVEAFETTSEIPYVSFATDAINVIYHLANKPGEIIKSIMQKMLSETTEVDVPISSLAKFLYVIGHVTICHMVHLDVDVYRELKRRNVAREASKGKTNNKIRIRNESLRASTSSSLSVASTPSETDFSSARKARRSIHNRNMSLLDDADKDSLSGAVGEDTEALAIDESLENCVITGDGFLAQFVPLVLDVCQHPEKYNNTQIQVWGILALSKMMTVSSEFCKQHLQLLITILEKSTYPEVKSNILVGLSDLMIRFPNDVEPWTIHMYNRLHDTDVSVRSTALRVLSNLVKREMIRAKGQMSEIAMCIVDDHPQIRNDAELFFYELSQKGNILYNILPDIISRLTSIDHDIDEDNLHTILKYIMRLLQKEREIDALMDKICARFKLATTERQWRDLAYCLSLLPLGKKGITSLIRNLSLLKDKLHNRQVYTHLKDIIEAAKKKAETKEAGLMLEKEIDRLLSGEKSDDNTNKEDTDNGNNDNNDIEMDNKDSESEIMPPPSQFPKKKRLKRKR